MAKRIPKTEEQKLLDDLVEELTEELKSILPETIRRVKKITNRDDVTVQVLSGIFGGKNNTYVDSVKTQFLDFNDFFAQWMQGLLDAAEKQVKLDRIYSPHMTPMDRASYRNAVMLKDPVVMEYAKKLLQRNFYKNLRARTRLKPDESLWTVWFGYQLIYGLFIAPQYYKGEWHTDKSEMRRVSFDYWTVGHALHTGFIDPELKDPIAFYDYTQFYQFYLSQMKRISSSTYEKALIDRYVAYLKKSKNLDGEPLLIPELRYNGLDHTHKYRLDFTVLNVHTNEYTGFEISPASTHMKVTGLKEKQAKVNEELKKDWAREMSKRNEYFQKYNITTFTFTDDDLKDIDECFEVIQGKLEARPKDKPTLKKQLERLQKI